MRSARAAALALFVVACTREHAVPIELVVPPATGSLSYELWVLGADDACPSVEQLATGGPTTMPLAYVTFSGDRGPELGRLDVDRAKFVVIGRDTTCAPVLSACEALAIGEAGVRITLAPYAWIGADACGATRSCVDGACVSGDAGDMDGGVVSPDAGPDGGAPDASVRVCPTPMGGDGGVTGAAFDFTRIEMGSGLESFPSVSGLDRNAADVELRDLDGDDDLDVTIIDHHGTWPHGNGASRVYRNDGARTFADVTDAVFAAFLPTPATLDPNSAWSALWAPLDDDDRLDLFTGTADDDQGRLFATTSASGTPVASYLPLFPGVSAGLVADSAAVGDVNADGWLDVLLAHGGFGPRLFLNGGATDGVWVDATASWLPGGPLLFSAFRPILADFDDDGDLDLLIQQQLEGARTTPEQWAGVTLGAHYLENVGTGFEDRTETSGVSALFADGALAVGDFDGDGDLDLVQVGKPAELTTTAEHVLGAPNEVRVLRNDGGTFADVSATAFPVDPPILYDVFASNEQAATGDFDNDGLLDVVVIRDRPMIWENLGPPGIRFHVAQELPAAESHRRVAVGDLDADGDVDFAATQLHTGSGVRVFENQRGGAGALRIVLRGSSPNAFGIGARITVYAVEAGARGRPVASREVIASTDQHVDYTQHVALPSDDCYEVEVRWPHVEGAADRVETVLVVREPFAQPLPFPR